MYMSWYHSVSYSLFDGFFLHAPRHAGMPIPFGFGLPLFTATASVDHALPSASNCKYGERILRRTSIAVV
jgi:hypothetical protein